MPSGNELEASTGQENGFLQEMKHLVPKSLKSMEQTKLSEVEAGFLFLLLPLLSRRRLFSPR